MQIPLIIADYFTYRSSSRASNVDMSSTKSFEVQNEFQPVDEDEGPLIAGKVSLRVFHIIDGKQTIK